MPFTLPDIGTGQVDIQSILFKEHLEVLMAGIQGIDYPFSGLACSAQGVPDMTVAVAASAAVTNGVFKNVSAGNATITAASGANPRIDLVVINSSGAIAVRAGTPSAAPKPPARSANDVVLASVYVPTSAMSITSGLVTDMRVLRNYSTLALSLGADQSNSTTTPTEVTGLTVPLEVGTYVFDYRVAFQAAATTTGVKISVNFSGASSSFVANHMFACDAVGNPIQAYSTTPGGYMGVFSARAASNSGWGTTASVDAANSDMLFLVNGLIKVTGSGNLQLWHGSEVAASSTIKAGSSLLLRKTG